MIKRLFVFTCPRQLSEPECEKWSKRFAEVLTDCGINCRVLVLDGGWTMQEFVPDEVLIQPEPDGD